LSRGPAAGHLWGSRAVVLSTRPGTLVILWKQEAWRAMGDSHFQSDVTATMALTHCGAEIGR